MTKSFLFFFSLGKDTDLGSALPAGPAKAAGDTGTFSTAKIGTRTISRSGTGSTSGIGTGTERGTGTTETGEPVPGVLPCLPRRGVGSRGGPSRGARAEVVGRVLSAALDRSSRLSPQEFGSKWFLMDSYLLTSTRTT